MSMSTHVVGFVPPDDKWLQMKQVWDACKAASIRAPEEVQKFFNWVAPDEAGVEIDLGTLVLKPWKGENQNGYEVDIPALARLHPHVKKIRFFNAY